MTWLLICWWFAFKYLAINGVANFGINLTHQKFWGIFDKLPLIAEKKCSLGYLTDTKSILKSINFTNKENLAQYLKENIINFCKWEIKWLSQ